MLITRIEQGKGKRYKIYADSEFLFALYGKEMKRFGITEKKELADETVEDIYEHVIYKRARERALYLLERRPYSSFLMKRKLLESDYPNSIVTRVVTFLEKYHYLDDVQYCTMYMDTYSVKKSKRQLQMELIQKGIDKDIICEAMHTSNYSEEDSFKRQFERYVRGKDLKDMYVRQKVFRYFCGKGYSYHLIEEYLRKDEWKEAF